MAKINDTVYLEKTSVYREASDNIIKEEQNARADITGGKPGSALKRLELSEAMLDLASNYMVINGVSLSVKNLKDEEALNEARKSLYKSIIYLEETVSSYVDAPFSDYEEKLSAIESVSPEKRYSLVQKMGLAIQLLENAYGDNTKWKWTFVELEGRFAAVAKNIINLRDIITNSDPRSPNYEPTILHMRLVKKLLAQAADRYREKYESSTNRIDDFKIGVNFLSALKRMNNLTGDQAEAATVKKKLEIWNNKLTTDMNKQEALLSKKG